MERSPLGRGNGNTLISSEAALSRINRSVKPNQVFLLFLAGMHRAEG